MTERTLHALGRKILRMYGPIQEKGRWRPRWNSEIYSLCKDVNIVYDIKIRRLESATVQYNVVGRGLHTHALGDMTPQLRWAYLIPLSAMAMALLTGSFRAVTRKKE
jgi:hypothetical protein